jgi:hypothetical protein
VTAFKKLLCVVAAAFVLRAGLAVVTETRPIFPDFYYTDARLADKYAWDLAESWRTGEAPKLGGSATQTAQGAALAALYRVFGRRPLAGKLLNAVLASLALLPFFFLLRRPFGDKNAVLSCALIAFWPSHIFFTSQNFKEAPVMLLAYGALAGFLIAPGAALTGVAGRLTAGFCCVILLSFLRTYLALLLSAAVAGAAALSLLRRAEDKRRRAAVWATLLTALLAPAAFRPVSRVVFEDALRLSETARSEALAVVPVAVHGEAPPVRPLSPEGIAEFRRIHQSHDRQYAHYHVGREVGTQLFYGLQLRTWLDVALFLPKGMFYTLFMPLPLLYPIAGKLGRLASAAENTLLLALALLAAAGLRRLDRRALAVGGMLLFFCLMAAGSGLLEFDLGSASRHKLLYMPLLFPLAAAAAFGKEKL